MGYLSGKMTYLAGPISLVDDCTSWRDYISGIISSKYNVLVQDPCKVTTDGLNEVGSDKEYLKQLIRDKQYARVKKEFYKVIRKDLKQVDKSDFIIVYHDPLVPTVGTIHEIIIANIKKCPILIMCPEDKVSNINPWLLTLIKPQWLFTTWEEMIKYLDVINTGDLDSSHWW